MRAYQSDLRETVIPGESCLVSVRYVDGLAALSDVADDAGAPRDLDLVLLLHLQQRRSRAHVEELRHQAPAPRLALLVVVVVASRRVLAVGVVGDRGVVGSDRAGLIGPVIRRGRRRVVRHRGAPLALNEEQRAAIRVQQRTDVLQDLVAQGPHVQLVIDVFDLRNRHSLRAKGYKVNTIRETHQLEDEILLVEVPELVPGSPLRPARVAGADLRPRRLTGVARRHAQEGRRAVDRVDDRLQEAASLELVCRDLAHRRRGTRAAGTATTAGRRVASRRAAVGRTRQLHAAAGR